MRGNAATPDGVFSAVSFTYASTTTHVRLARQRGRGVRSPSAIFDIAAFMEASAIKQRSLLPRGRWCDFFFTTNARDHPSPPSPPLSSPIDASAATFPRRPSRRTRLFRALSPFLAFLWMRVRGIPGDSAQISRLAEFGDLTGNHRSEDSRISYVLISSRAGLSRSRRQPEAGVSVGSFV